jgi:hypothetical protein
MKPNAEGAEGAGSVWARFRKNVERDSRHLWEALRLSQREYFQTTARLRRKVRLLERRVRGF